MYSLLLHFLVRKTQETSDFIQITACKEKTNAREPLRRKHELVSQYKTNI